MKQSLHQLLWPLCCSLLLLSGPSYCKAQSEQATIGVNHQFHVEVIGAIVHPGFQAGISIPALQRQLTKVKKKRTITSTKTAYWNVQAGYFNHLHFQNNVYLSGQRSVEKKKQKDRYRKFSYGVGLNRAAIPGAVYNVDDAGQVSTLGNQAFWQGILQCGLYWGFKPSNNMHPYVGLSQMTFFPHNGLIYPRLLLHAGISLKGKSISRIPYKEKTKEKR